jgi:hypothetical protein
LSDIYAIVTHHEDPDGAAEAWKRDGVCAIGWSDYGNLRNLPKEKLEGRAALATRLFLGMQPGDIVLAYSMGNTIAYIGTLTGRYKHYERNEVGSPDRYSYPNQRAVKWWDKPHHFDRRDLPTWIANQLGKRGLTVTRLDIHEYGFGPAVEIIRTCARSGSALGEFEDLAKAGIRKYANQRIGELEPGLRITAMERSITERDRPDFIASDRKGSTVLIECKGVAREGDCDQLLRYGADFKPKIKVSPRLMLVAFSFDQSCRKMARANGIEMIECELQFKKIK